MDLYEFDSFRFESRTRILLRDGREVPLARKTADLLLLFLKRPGQVLLKEELQSGLWADAFVEADNNLTLNIHHLRDALGRRADGENYIETLPKRGYRFLATVTKVYPEQIRTSVPLLPIQPPPDEKIQRAPSDLLAGDQHHFATPRRISSFALIGAILLLGLVSGAVEFRPWAAPRLAVKDISQLTSDARDKVGPALFTDGARVYFTELGPNGRTLASVAVQGGATGTMPFSLQDTTIYDLSPLRSEVLASRGGSNGLAEDLWMIPLFGGSPRRVGAVHTHSATLSPDRTQIASILGKELYFLNSDGTHARKIATVPEGSSWLRWSPDGKKLRFTLSAYRNGDAQDSIWEIAADGTNLHQLLLDWHDPPRECCGNWTPDGDFYLFQSMRAGHTDLWALPERQTLFNKRASAPIQLTSGLLELSQPLVSNDGKHVFAVGIKKQGELVRYDSVVHEFVKFLGGISATWVTFSKSGHRVAYLDYPSLTLWRANSDGSERRQLTFAPFEVDGYSWSPDEQTLAVRGRNPGSTWRIYLVRSAGGAPETLIPGEKEQGVPTWSADGTRLCFGDVPAAFGKPGGTEAIHIFDLRARQLSDLPGSQGLWTSRWSPDGLYVSALTIDGQKVMLFDFSKNAWRATDAANVNNPNWSADGKYIYYDTEWPNPTLRRVRVSDGSVDQLTSLREYPNLAWWWSGLTPSNDPLLLRNLGTSEIYSLALEDR